MSVGFPLWLIEEKLGKSLPVNFVCLFSFCFFFPPSHVVVGFMDSNHMLDLTSYGCLLGTE